jgi:hypothetical protein
MLLVSWLAADPLLRDNANTCCADKRRSTKRACGVRSERRVDNVEEKQIIPNPNAQKPGYN